MRPRSLFPGLVAAFVLTGILAASALAAPPPVVLRAVRLFDPVAGTMSAPCDVLLQDGRIAATGPKLRTPRGAIVRDAAGKFAVAGLFDCHTHLATATRQSPDSLRAVLAGFVARGVTCVRDAGGPLDVMRSLARRTQGGELPGPEIFYAGPMLERSPLTHGAMNDSLPGFTVAVDSVTGAERVVAELAAGGATLVKTFGRTEPTIYRRLVAAARARGLPVMHDPGELLFHAMPIDSALALGVTCFEHGKAPWPVVLRAGLKAEHDSLLAAGAPPIARMGLMQKVVGAGAQSVDLARLHALAARMRAQGAYLCPTLQVLDGIEETAFAQVKARNNLTELPEPMKQGIRSMVTAMTDVSRLCARTLAADGVRFLVGQDNAKPELTLHEMQRLAEVGVSPAEILRGATLYPAQWLGVDDRLGSLAPGKEATLVLLGADPLADIGNVARVVAVFQRGQEVRQQER